MPKAGYGLGRRFWANGISVAFFALALTGCGDNLLVLPQTPVVPAADRLGNFVMRNSHADVDWPVYDGHVTGDHYSSLSQINRSNVAQLKVAWQVRHGGKGRHRDQSSHRRPSPLHLYSFAESHCARWRDWQADLEIRFGHRRNTTGSRYHLLDRWKAKPRLRGHHELPLRARRCDRTSPFPALVRMAASICEKSFAAITSNNQSRSPVQESSTKI